MFFRNYYFGFAVFLLLMLQQACTPKTTATEQRPTEQIPTTRTSRSSSVYVEDYGAVGDGKTDDTEAFVQAIRKANIRKIENDFKKGGWGGIKATEIRLQGDRIYRITRPVDIPANRNLTIRSDAMGGATILYEGKGNIALRFQPKSINAAVLIDGVNFKYGGVELIGPMRGKILLQNNQFIRSKGPGISIIDREDIKGQEKRGGFGVVHWILWNNEFHYCDQGVYIDSKSILLGHIELNRFRSTVNEPIYIDGTGVIVDNNEFMGVENRTNPFIRLTPKSNFISAIKITRNRFGSEATLFEGRSFAPPISFITIESEKNYVSNVDVLENMFFTNKVHIKTKNSAEHAISIYKKVHNLNIENNDFRHFKSFIINNPVEVKNCKFHNNAIYSKQTLFRQEGAGFKISK